jgi:hypothetical protein
VLIGEISSTGVRTPRRLISRTSTRTGDRDRSCYTRANDRNLTGDSRRSFLRTCLSDYRAKQ